MATQDNQNDEDSYIEDIFSSIFNNTQTYIKDNDHKEDDSLDYYVFSSDIKQNNLSFIEEEISEISDFEVQAPVLTAKSNENLHGDILTRESIFPSDNTMTIENCNKSSYELYIDSQGKESEIYCAGKVFVDLDNDDKFLDDEVFSMPVSEQNEEDCINANDLSFIDDDLSSVMPNSLSYRETYRNDDDLINKPINDENCPDMNIDKQVYNSCIGDRNVKDDSWNCILNNESMTKDSGRILTGFTTGNNRAINVREESLLKAEDMNMSIFADTTIDTHQSDILQNKSTILEKEIVTGFTTGNNKAIKIKEESLLKAQDTSKEVCSESHFGDNAIENQNKTETKVPYKNTLVKTDLRLQDDEVELETFFKKRKTSNNEDTSVDKVKEYEMKQENHLKPKSIAIEPVGISKTSTKPNDCHGVFYKKNRPMRSYLKPEKGHVTTEHNYIADCQAIYDDIKSKNPDVEKKVFFQHFKWSWISLAVRNKIDSTAAENVKHEVSKRIQNEYSVLRRIIEGDDIPQKYMTLLVISAKDKSIEVFDGFFTVTCLIDNDLQRNVISQKIRFGTFLLVMNAELLIENKPFEDVSGQVLKLCYNSTKIVNPKKLGYQRNIGFCTYLQRISKTGGTICGLELEVVKILESKISIKVGNYVNTIFEKDFEKEVEKIETMVRDANSDKVFVPSITRYTKINARDKYNQMCILTWNECEDIKVGHFYRFMNLRILQKPTGIHLVTHKQTYIKRIPSLL